MSTEVHDGSALRVTRRFGHDSSVAYRALADPTIAAFLEGIG